MITQSSTGGMIRSTDGGLIHIRQIYADLTDRKKPTHAAEEGLYAEFYQTIEDRPGITAKELGERFGLTQQHAASVVNYLRQVERVEKAGEYRESPSAPVQNRWRVRREQS